MLFFILFHGVGQYLLNVNEFKYPTDHMVFLTLGIFMFNSIFMIFKTIKNIILSTPLLLSNEHYGHSHIISELQPISY